MTDNPMFSVIIPVYNKLPHIERAVNSVLQQTFRDFEVILIDDASTDGSSEKLLNFKDPRLSLLKRDRPGAGGYAARNLGIAHASAPYICFLDADDEWMLDVLETVYGVIQNNQDAEIVSWGWYRTVGENKVSDTYSFKYGSEKVKTFSLTDYFVGPQTMWMGANCIRRELILSAGAFPEKGFKRGGDFDTWVRCVWNSKKNVRICKPMTYYYLDSVNMITKSVARTTAFLYTPHLMHILQTSEDPKLREAIIRFQNSYLYLMVNGYVFQGEAIQYDLVRKINFNAQGVWLILKLHLNRLRFFILGAPKKNEISKVMVKPTSSKKGLKTLLSLIP